MTTNAEFEKIEALLPDFQYIDDDNDDRIIVSIGFVATFYFGGGHTISKRLALADCFEAYLAAYGSRLGWHCDPTTWQPTSLAKRQVPSLRNYIQGLDEDDAIGWYLASGSDPEAVSDYAISCLTERGWEHADISCLQLQFPRAEVFDDDKRGVVELLMALCVERLSPLHGSAGLAAITIEDSMTWQPEVLDLSTRYLGLQIEDIVMDSNLALDGPKGCNWLSFIGDIFTERLGGPQAFSDYCRRFGVASTRSANGFILRAGALPQLGPANEAPPQQYAQVNAVLRPLRNGKLRSMGIGSTNGELRFNQCSTDLWMRRFDAPGIWPPASFIGLTGAPVGKVPGKIVKLRTGGVCAVHGRYQPHPIQQGLDEDGEERIPTVVLLPGDIAPYLLRLGSHGVFFGRDAITWALAVEL